MKAQWRERFAGIDRLYGVGTVERLAACRVAVVGMGGVGSWVVEALARTGVGHIRLIDADDLCVSNTNRQLPALAGQYGRNKARAMAERCVAINPEIEADAVESFLTAGNIEQLLGDAFDLVIDACDSFRVKVETIAWCRRRKLPLLTVGAAGGRTDATLVRVRDVSRTEHDAMLALIRKKLRSGSTSPRIRSAISVCRRCTRWRTSNIRRPMAASAASVRSWMPTPRSSWIAGQGWAQPRISPAPLRLSRWARRWRCCSSRRWLPSLLPRLPRRGECPVAASCGNGQCAHPGNPNNRRALAVVCAAMCSAASPRSCAMQSSTVRR